MSRLSKDGLQEVTKQIKNPLESIYNKFEKKGSLRWSDVKDEYDFIYKFLGNLESWVKDDEVEVEPTVVVNNKVYKPE